MPNYLPVPPELQHLIEKRETDERRKKECRSGQDRRSDDSGRSGAVESPDDLDDPPAADRRAGDERREDRDRREAARRQTDAEPLPPDPPEQQSVSTHGDGSEISPGSVSPACGVPSGSGTSS